MSRKMNMNPRSLFDHSVGVGWLREGVAPPLQDYSLFSDLLEQGRCDNCMVDDLDGEFCDVVKEAYW